MPPEEIDSLDADSLKGLVLSLIARIDGLVEQNKALLARIDELHQQNKTLLARIAELEASAGKPPKTPTNSSLPPSSGQKANVQDASATNKSRKGVARELCPNPDVTRNVYAERCDCGEKVPPLGQVLAQAYDHIELPPTSRSPRGSTCIAVIVPAVGKPSPPSRPPTCHPAPRSALASSRLSRICTAARW